MTRAPPSESLPDDVATDLDAATCTAEQFARVSASARTAAERLVQKEVAEPSTTEAGLLSTRRGVWVALITVAVLGGIVGVWLALGRM